MRGEFDWIRDLEARVGATRRAGDGVRVGIGDDAAVLVPPPGHEVLVTTDLLVEDVHFRLAGEGACSPEDLGWKSLAVSVSDIASMGGRSAHAVVSVALRTDQSGAFADGVLRGLLACAARYGVALVGGDTTGTPGPVVVNVTLLGYAPAGRAVLRSGAQVGDAICVTGALGGSILGRHLRVMPRQDEALSLVQDGPVHAMIDVSDGISSDLGHVLDRSGVAAELWAGSIPVHDDACARSAITGEAPLFHALHDGEDFELLFTVPDGRALEIVRTGLCGTRVSQIGRIVAGPPGACVLRAAETSPEPGVALVRRGHDHFRRD